MSTFPQSPYLQRMASKSPAGGIKDHGNMFRSNTWRDIWAAILYYLHLGVFFVIVGYSGSFVFEHFKGVEVAVGDISRGKIAILVGSCGIGLSITLLLTIATLVLIYNAPEASITFSMLGSAALYGIIAVISMVSGSFIPAFFALLMACLMVIFYFVFRSRIPFTAVLMRTVTTVLKRYPAMLCLSAGSLFFDAFVSLLMALGLVGIAVMHEDRAISSGLIKAMGVYLLFSMYWQIQVIQNVVQTTVAGVFATFYFIDGSGQRVSNPTANSLKRALTLSFGSIAFGSLIVALIQLVRALVQSQNNRNSLAGAIFDCIMGLIQSLVEYFNYYAYTYIAIYGMPYLEAGKATFRLVKERGIDAIVNDSLVGRVLMMFTLLISLISAASVFFFSLIFLPFELAVIASGISLVVAILIPNVAFEVFGAGVTATFVCYAEDPLALQRTKPELYHEISVKQAQI